MCPLKKRYEEPSARRTATVTFCPMIRSKSMAGSSDIMSRWKRNSLEIPSVPVKLRNNKVSGPNGVSILIKRSACVKVSAIVSLPAALLPAQP